ncbi:DUF3054 domain-containing protein [Halovenus halobia]|uniref:DUF3054 domain-containing protein n=1 Tax=Halovenus halobia TaxID=3396622 RepID=UPI003F568DC8
MSYGQRVRPLVRARIPTTPTAAAVVLGDLLVLFAVFAYGQSRHGYLFWERPERTALIVAPFALGWLVCGLLAGLFVPEPVRQLSIGQLVGTVFAAWIGAVLIGGALRATEALPGNSPVVFLVVQVVFGALFLLPWRVAVQWRL